MSRRHRNGSAKLPKEARRLDHRRERHAAKAALLATDPDAVVVPRSRTAPPSDGAATAAMPAEPARRQWRHWKAPFWKRRNAERRRRNELLARLA